MDGSQFIDSLESLWFFSNVLCPTTQPLGPAGAQEEPAKPMTKVEENQQNESPPNQNLGRRNQHNESPPTQNLGRRNQHNESPPTQNLGRRCSICGEFAVELEPQVEHLQPVGMEVPAELTKPEKRKSERSRRRRRRSKRSLNERRQILGELDLGFDNDMGYNQSSSWLFEETLTSGYQMFGSQVRYNMNMKMPPLNDGMAMKEHLKSWAYAVACTVR